MQQKLKLTNTVWYGQLCHIPYQMEQKKVEQQVAVVYSHPHVSYIQIAFSDGVGALRGDTSFSLTLEICMNDWCEKPTFCCDVAATTGGRKTTRSRAVSVRLYSSSHRSKEMDAHLYRLYWCYLIAGQQQLSWCALPVARTTQQVSLLLLGFY